MAVAPVFNSEMFTPNPGNPAFLGLPSGARPPAKPIAQTGTGPTDSVFNPQQFNLSPQGKNTSGMQGNYLLSSNAEKTNQSNLIGESHGILDFASGDPTTSPLYKSLLSSSRSAIGNSYDQAVANTRASAASRGFGYESPNEQGAEAGTRAQEAGALAAAPSQALQATIAPELQAAGIETSQAGQYGLNAMTEEQMATALQEARMKKQEGLTVGLAEAYAQMAGSAMHAGG